MTDDPRPDEPRNQLPAEKETQGGRSFPLLAPTIIVALALLMILLFWLLRR